MNTILYLLLGAIFFFIRSSYGIEVADDGGREALEIIIGGGGGGYTPSPGPESPDCPPPPPPPEPVCPPPPPEPVCPPPLSQPSPRPSPPPPPPPPKHFPPPPPRHFPPPPPRHFPPPPPPPSPKRSPPPPLDKPLVFESILTKRSFYAIQRFKSKVYDPLGCTKTWDPKEGKVCKYYKGFACDTRPDKNITAVASIDLNGCGLSGKDGKPLDLSEFLESMVDVALLHVNSNNFTGKIPDISKLKYLYEFDISNNKFSGNFPTQVFTNNNYITFLDLRFNSFSGQVPPAIFSNLDLDVLFINNNNFKQPLPSLASKTVLYLTFANNMFTGEIPRTIGNAEKLREVLFINNQLSGCLPYEIGKLDKATVFDVGFNQLTGPIPHSFSCLKKMELMSLAHNKLDGIVPESLCELPNLSNLTLSYNYFTQVGTKCRELIDKYKILDIRMNCIRGLKYQRSEKECADFFNNQPSCPDMKSFTYVPCENKYSDSLESMDSIYSSLETAPAPAPRAYEALAPSW